MELVDRNETGFSVNAPFLAFDTSQGIWLVTTWKGDSGQATAGGNIKDERRGVSDQ